MSIEKLKKQYAMFPETIGTEDYNNTIDYQVNDLDDLIEDMEDVYTQAQKDRDDEIVEMIKDTARGKNLIFVQHVINLITNKSNE